MWWVKQLILALQLNRGQPSLSWPEDDMSLDTLVRRLLDTQPTLQRTSWAPVVEAEAGGGGRFKTKFGGNKPFRPTNFKWPICEECHAHKSFLCQLNLEDLPPPYQQISGLTEGLFQVYYCLECLPLNCFKDLYFIKKTDFIPSLSCLAAEVAVKEENYSEQSLPRTLLHFVQDSTETPDIEFDGETFEERIVSSWTQSDHLEIPQPQEIQTTNGGELERRSGLSVEELGRLYDQLDSSSWSPGGGIKLGGWVRWCQGVEYPTCPSCHVLMTTTFLQLEEDDLYPFSWGDSGTGHVTLCPTCGEAGLSWACC